MSNANSLLQFLSSDDVSNTLLYWINCFPFQSCQEATKLTDLRDAVALSEILVNIDENYFKDLKSLQVVDKNLWLVHLVQLKKLFLKLSAYVELYLKQDWSLLPVPDFKLVARSEEVTAHLNFMVAAVLLTATHCGKNLEFEKILELVIPGSLRKEIQSIQDAFLMVLEPKSPKSFPNSPRKSSLNPLSNITPKALFPSALSKSDPSFSIEKAIEEFQEFDIKLQEIQGNTTATKQEDNSLQIIEFEMHSTTNNITITEDSFNSDFVNLQNEIKILEIKLSETDKLLQKSKESEMAQVQTLQTLTQTQGQLAETIEQLNNLKAKQEFEKIERNSLLAAFDHERQVAEDQLDYLKKEKDQYLSKIENLLNENKFLKDDLSQRDQQYQLLQSSQAEKIVETEEAFKDELNQSRLNCSKLVKALKKARDHIISQDSLIKELKDAVNASELGRSELSKSKDEELQFLKESFEKERTTMNQVLIDLGTRVQKLNL